MLLTCGAAGCIEREHSLNGDVHGGNVEGFEHNLEGQQGGKDRLTTPLRLLGYGMLRNLLKGENYANSMVLLYPISTPTGPALGSPLPPNLSRSVRTFCCIATQWGRSI